MTRQTVSTGTVWEEDVGYSRAVRVGDRIEVSGTTATNGDGDVVGVGDPYAQATQAMFVTDVEHYDEIGRAHGEAFGDVRPATSMYEVEALIDPEMLVEIEAAAIVEE